MPEVITFLKKSFTTVVRLVRPIRTYLGLYSFTSEESAAFNPTIEPYYFRLRADYKRLCKEGGAGDCPGETRESLEKIINDLDVKPSLITRSDLYAIESLLFAMAKDDYIDQSYPSLQDRYKSLAGSAAFDRYKSSRADGTDKTPAKKRADALFLLSELRRLSIAIPRRESIRAWLLVNVLTASAIAAGAVGYVLRYWRWLHFPFLLVVSLLSLFGGVISVYRRLQKTPDDELTIGQWGRVSLVLSPITSMGFGIILYYILAGNLINGAIFPDVKKLGIAHPPCCDASPNVAASQTAMAPSTAQPTKAADSTEIRTTVIKNTASRPCPPCKSQDSSQFDGWSVVEWITIFDFPEFCKLLVWAFIAGFAEQFVPDTLDSLIKRQTATGGKASDVKPSGN